MLLLCPLPVTSQSERHCNLRNIDHLHLRNVRYCCGDHSLKFDISTANHSLSWNEAITVLNGFLDAIPWCHEAVWTTFISVMWLWGWMYGSVRVSCLSIQIVDLDVGVVLQEEAFIAEEYDQLWRDLFMGCISLFYYLFYTLEDKSFEWLKPHWPLSSALCIRSSYQL